MAELTIVFRLRFAVALALALGILLFAGTRDAWSAEYIVQMEPGSAPSTGAALVERLGGRVTSPELEVINGFGASLDAEDAAPLEASAGVRTVTPNGSVATSSHSGRRGRDRDDDGERRDRDRDDDRRDRDDDRRDGDRRDRDDDRRDRDDDDDRGDRDDDDDGWSGGYRCRGSDATTRAPRDLRATAATPEELHPLASLPRLAQPLQHAVKADVAWQRATGKGVGVAVIDTGISGDLPDFRDPDDPSQSRVIATAVTNPCARDASDHYGHGTHVAGLIAGNSLHYRDEARGRYMGVAPDANLISVKTSDDDGNATILDVIYGIQFAVDHKQQFGIRVINLSLSSAFAQSYRTDPLDAAVESAWFSGLVVVAAAGNEGSRPGAVSYAPGNDPYVITAGASNDRGTWTTADDLLATWSSRGRTQDGVPKPDVLAPGSRIVSSLAPYSDFYELCRDCVVDDRYFRVSGTSMSTAVASGVAALMLEEHPEWTPNQVKGAMIATLATVPAAGGVVDAAAALDGSGVANGGLVPNVLISPDTGEIDWTRASFRRASFRNADGSRLDASWSRASFRCDCSLLESGYVDPRRSSFRVASFKRTSDFAE